MHRSLRTTLGLPIWLYKSRALKVFLERLKNARAIQRSILDESLRAVAGSRFSRDFKIPVASGSSSPLRRTVPLLSYEDIEPYILEAKAGNTKALLNSLAQIKMFALTSGTSGPAKYIPVTDAGLLGFRRGIELWAIAVGKIYSEIPFGMNFSLISSHRQDVSESGKPVGSIAGFIFLSLYRWTRAINVLTPEILAIKDRRDRLKVSLALAASEIDVKMISVANPMTLINLAEQLKSEMPSFIKGLHDGIIQLDSGQSFKIQKNRLRAQHLARLLDSEFTPTKVWPNLRVLGVWQGGTLSHYLPEIRKVYEKVDLWDPGLIASEAHMTLPLFPNTSTGLLNVESAYFEFSPNIESQSVDDETLEFHQLETGKSYVIIVTTPSGLIRYKMNDVVRCEGYAHGVPLISFLRKTSQLTNLTGEKLSSTHANQLLHFAKEVAPVRVIQGVVAPVMSKRPRYHFYCEMKSNDLDALYQLQTCLDEKLKHLNIEYKDKRESGKLSSLKVLPMSARAFEMLHDELLAKNPNGEEQFKTPVLLEDTLRIDAIRGLRK